MFLTILILCILMLHRMKMTNGIINPISANKYPHNFIIFLLCYEALSKRPNINDFRPTFWKIIKHTRPIAAMKPIIAAPAYYSATK